MSVVNLKIKSFSYRGPIPGGGSENGGGFVFDCRCLKNPGREERYKTKTGLDSDVKDFLSRQPEADQFYSAALQLVRLALGAYRDRGFTDLMVSFGCTGGQHRSVYFAERLAADLQRENFLKIEVEHQGLEKLGYWSRPK